jgi:aspartate aminotransferase
MDKLGKIMGKLAKITENLIGQPMFKLLAHAQELEKQGKRVIHYEIGDPSFNTPSHIIDAAKSALDANQTHYTNSQGIYEFREAIANTTHSDLGYRPEMNQILVCPANAIIDFTLRCLVNPGEEVILPDPGFPTYYSAIAYNNIIPVRVPLKEKNNFQMDPLDIRERITEKTRLIIINSPHNPTGAVMNSEFIREIYKIAEEFDLFLLSDEVYSKLIYDKSHHSPTIFDKCIKRTILLNSLSKMYAMSGWRLGYAIGPQHFIEKMGLLVQTILSCLPEFSQRGGIAALTGGQTYLHEMVRIFKKRRDLLVEGLNSINGIRCVLPEGAFYLMPRIDHPGMTGIEYTENLLAEEGICLLPGSGFGQHGSNFKRLSYSATTTEMIEESLEKIENFHKVHF